MTEQDIKLECLRISGGSLSDAKELFDWVVGNAQADPSSLPSNVAARTLMAQRAAKGDGFPYDNRP